jgi:hypothetical protein
MWPSKSEKRQIPHMHAKEISYFELKGQIKTELRRKRPKNCRNRPGTERCSFPSLVEERDLGG